MKPSKKLKRGDVAELAIGSGFGYVQFIGTHREYGDAIRVKPGLSERRSHFEPRDFADAYFTFYPLHEGVKRGAVAMVGHFDAPALPSRYRRPGAIRPDGTVASWVLEGGWRGFVGLPEQVRRLLSGKELRLPIAGIWNHDFLVHRIQQGWRPNSDPSTR